MSNRQGKKAKLARRYYRQAPSEESKVRHTTMTNDFFPRIRPNLKQLGGFPVRNRVKMKYVDFITLDPGAAATASSVYGINCLFDPYIGAGGHQPSNYDRWTQIYRNFTVVSCDILLEENSSDIVNVIPGLYGFLIDTAGNQIGAGTTAESIAEQPYVQYSTSGLRAGGYTGGALRAHVDCWEWFGMKNAESMVLNNNFTTYSTANPAVPLFAEIFLAAFSGDNPGATIFRLELVFDVIMSDPQLTASS